MKKTVLTICFTLIVCNTLVAQHTVVNGPIAYLKSEFFGSCYYPSFYSDSIIDDRYSSTINVTIPAGMVVTNLYITASFYADPIFDAWIANGIMYFKTPCDTSLYYYNRDTVSDAPGLGYMDAQSMDSTLFSCFSLSPDSQTFPITMFLSRNYGDSALCNDFDFIYYDPGAGGLGYYPFEAYVAGYAGIYTGVKSYSINQFSIYPNPATNQLTIHTSSFNNEGVMVEVMNVMGQEASPPALLPRRGEDAVIDVSALAAGVYFVQLKSEGGSVAKMFVKE